MRLKKEIIISFFTPPRDRSNSDLLDKEQNRTENKNPNGSNSNLQPNINPNRAGLLDVAWKRGGWISPHLLDHLKTLWKTKKFFFDFLKVHNELGKVTKFWTSRPLFSWRNSHLKKVWADSPPPAPIGLNFQTKFQIISNFEYYSPIWFLVPF